MRRIVIWLASTVTVLVLLFGYHTSTNSPAPAAAASAPATGHTDPTAGPTAESSSGTPASASASAPTTSTPGSSTAKAYTGDVAQTRWGPVQVKIAVSGGKITDVTVPTYPNGNHRDAEINSYALPILVQDTLSAQSAKIDMVSSATVTSEGYLQSLQSALDRAGI